MAKKQQMEQKTTKNIKELISNVEKKFGNGAIMPLGDDFVIKCNKIPSGSISVDYIMGNGWPKGRVCEVMGPEAGGKTTLALQAAAQAQKMGYVAAMIDAEHALDINYAKLIGIDIDNLLMSQPDYGEQALEIAEMMVESGQVDIIIIDSVAALVPLEELNGELMDANIGAQARMMSKFLRRITSKCKKSDTCIIFINQLRQKIGGMSFGSNETTPGGKALKFYSSMRLDVRRISSLKQGEDIIGHRAKIKVVKNKVAIPFKICEVDIVYGQGVSSINEIIELGSKYNLIEKSGSWYSYQKQRIGNGLQAAAQHMSENLELKTELETKIREIVFGNIKQVSEQEVETKLQQINENDDLPEEDNNG